VFGEKISSVGANFVQAWNTVKQLLTLFRRPSRQSPGSRRAQAIENLATEPQQPALRDEQSFQAQADCLHAIIHRLSQPLTALRGSLELALLTERSAAEYRRALRDSLAQADQLVWLLGSLRELAESEEPGKSAERIRLGGLVNEVIQELRPLASSRAIRVTLDSRDDLYVRGNSRRLQQAIFRVIHHAMERSPERATVRVVLWASDLYACLTVADEGPTAGPGGLDYLRQHAPIGRLFSETTKRGTLEWAIAKRIFDAQGGTALVENQRPAGCSFRAALPLASSLTSSGDPNIGKRRFPF